MRVLIDTNIILGIILSREKSYEARKLLENSEKFEFFLSDFSLHSIGILFFQAKKTSYFLSIPKRYDF